MSIRRVLATLIVLAVYVPACASRTPAPAGPPPAPAATCPPEVLASARDNGAACLDASVLGDATFDACAADLIHDGWQDDAMATSAISERLGKPVRCWHAAGTATP
jgi:hypothetical protein